MMIYFIYRGFKKIPREVPVGTITGTILGGPLTEALTLGVTSRV